MQEKRGTNEKKKGKKGELNIDKWEWELKSKL